MVGEERVAASRGRRDGRPLRRCRTAAPRKSPDPLAEQAQSLQPVQIFRGDGTPDHPQNFSVDQGVRKEDQEIVGNRGYSCSNQQE